MMNQLIGLLLPSVIGANVYEKLEGQGNNIRKIIERYLKCVLFVNLISYIITIYIFKKPEFIFTNQFTVKYVILSVVIANILPIAEHVVKKKLSIEIRIEEKKQ